MVSVSSGLTAFLIFQYAGAVRRCPFLEEDRKWLAERKKGGG
jgi:hypothetical protein